MILTPYAGLYQTLDGVLAADPRLVAQLLGYVRYGFNPGVQAAALRVAAALAARLPDLIPLLAGAGWLKSRPTSQRIQVSNLASGQACCD